MPWHTAIVLSFI